MSIPLLDAGDLLQGPVPRANFNRDLVKSLKAHGFVRIINHRVPDETVHQIFEWAQKFFSLPADEKFAIENIKDGNPQRGYSAVGVEKTSTLYSKKMGLNGREDLKDAREHLDCGAPNDKEFPNQWPSDEVIPGFRTFMEDYFHLLELTSNDLLTAMEEGLDVPQGTFTKRVTHDDNASELRINHYPPISLQSMRTGNVNRIWPHFDLGVITLLFASNVGGLEVEDRANRGQFIPIQPTGMTELIVNISETMERWTNNIVPAGLHQVSIPLELREVSEGEIPRRFSVAYLCKADRNVSVAPIDCFVSPLAIKPIFEEMTAIEYHKSRLQTAY